MNILIYVCFIHAIIPWFVFCDVAKSRFVRDVPSCEYGTVYNGTGCESCGNNNLNKARILGGLEVKRYAFPSHALVVQRYTTDTGSSVAFQCGGTLINRYTILTASHCINNQYEDINYPYDNVDIVPNNYYPTIESMFTVYLGAHDISFSKLTGEKNMPRTVLKVSVSKIIKHQNFDPVNILNDIALLILSEPVISRPHISPACLPNTVSYDYPQVNLPCYVAGWGNTREDGDSAMNLRYAKFTVYDFDYCSTVLPDIIKQPYSQVCAGYLPGYQDACQGDSGGGLYLLQQINDKRRLVASGIVSFGYGCGRKETPGIYTRVSYFLDWINQYWRL